MDRLDPRAPLVLDTRQLGRRAGAMQEVHRTVALGDDLGTDVIAVRAGDAIELELRLESVVEGVLVTGSVHGAATGACVRCLDEVSLPVDLTFQELFAYADRAAHHQEVGADSDEADVHELDGDLLDLEPVLRDAVVPALPFQPVCDPDCPGLCSQCGTPLVEDPGHTHEVIDPRWSALSGLLGTTADADGANSAGGDTETTDEKRN